MPPEDSSTSSPQEPALDASQPATESPSPVVEVPAETPPPEAVPSTPEPSLAPAEAPAPDSTGSPQAETDHSSTPTGQIGGNDPLPPKPDPIPSTQPAPEPSPSVPSDVPMREAASAQTGILRTARDLLVKARVTMQDRKRKKRDKIMEALTKKNKITNDEVEKLLHVSDATAERYLAVLVKEGKIKQDRKTGAGVAYTKI